MGGRPKMYYTLFWECKNCGAGGPEFNYGIAKFGCPNCKARTLYLKIVEFSNDKERRILSTQYVGKAILKLADKKAVPKYVNQIWG